MAAAKRSILTFVSTRYFQARPLKTPLPPPNPIKTEFDLSHTEPVKNLELAVTLSINLNIKYNQ